MSNDKKFIIIKDDRLWKSISRDTYSIGALLLAVGLGVVLDSTALQWIAGIAWILVIIGKASGEIKKVVTIKEARALLDAWERS